MTDDMAMTLIRGNKGLAKTLGVTTRTVQAWRAKGLLKSATVVDRSRVIVYNLDEVFNCLKSAPLKWPAQYPVKTKGVG